ncbi:MAG: hypothetical protein EYC62_07690 [Alphaproteobacteria bacterium]|nr:MAG: hypothetical protein EYC62_07690 [Alphaproteobacteria bacterium]
MILQPPLIAEIRALRAMGSFCPTLGAVDFGCGFFTLGIAMLREGIPTDGIDTAEAMVAASRSTIAQAATHLPSISGFTPRIVQSHSELPREKYGLGLLSFVHQCAANVGELRTLLTQVGNHLLHGGNLLMIGAHPNKANLSEPHASCEYDWPKDRDLADGDAYTGRIFNGKGEKVVDLDGERYWSLGTLRQILTEVGFYPENLVPIDDKPSAGRKASVTAPFFMLTAIKLDGSDPRDPHSMLRRLEAEGRLRN